GRARAGAGRAGPGDRTVPVDDSLRAAAGRRPAADPAGRRPGHGHRAMVAAFWHAQDLEETGAWEQAVPVWRIALACLAMLLTNDEFWVGWRQGRAARFRPAGGPRGTTAPRPPRRRGP